MNKKQIILFGSALISLACAFLWFVNWNAEGLFPKDQSTVTMRDIEDHPKRILPDILPVKILQA